MFQVHHHPPNPQANLGTHSASSTSSKVHMGTVERFVVWLLGTFEWALNFFCSMEKNPKPAEANTPSLDKRVTVGLSENDKALKKLKRQMGIRLAGTEIKEFAALCEKTSDKRLNQWSAKERRGFSKFLGALSSKPETRAIHVEVLGFFNSYMRENHMNQPMGKHFVEFLAQYKPFIDNDTYHKASNNDLLEEMAKQYDNGKDVIPDSAQMGELSPYNHDRLVNGIVSIFNENAPTNKSAIPELVAKLLRELKG